MCERERLTEPPHPPVLHDQALRGLHHPEMRFMDGMKRVCGLLSKSQKDLARVAYRRLRNDCLVTTGRKTGDDKVRIPPPPPRNVERRFLLVVLHSSAGSVCPIVIVACNTEACGETAGTCIRREVSHGKSVRTNRGQLVPQLFVLVCDCRRQDAGGSQQFIWCMNLIFFFLVFEACLDRACFLLNSDSMRLHRRVCFQLDPDLTCPLPLGTAVHPAKA